MSTEIELKYLILSEDVSTKIVDCLTSNKLGFKQQLKSLSNCYFDTPDLKLRKLDMGLRIRANGNELEQTIKTAGIEVAGLHQRPEYNISIDSTFPDLGLFPDEIWPQDVNLDELQAELISLFNTDFSRETWLIEFQDSVIELAFDWGEITSSDKQVDIGELELELVSGQRSDLLSLAKLLFEVLELRPGIQSKAKRGYNLFKSKEPDTFTLSSTIDNYPKTVNKAFLHGINDCVHQLQLAIDYYLGEPSLSNLENVTKVLSRLRHGFWLFDAKLSEKSLLIRNELSHFITLFSWLDNALHFQELMNKTGNYRKKLDYSAQLIEQLKLEKRQFPNEEMVALLLHSERFNSLQLSLLEMLISENKSDYFNSDERELLFGFAQEKLSESLAKLIDSMPEKQIVDAEQILLHRNLLHRNLLTGSWFGSLFDQEVRKQFRAPWLDMQQGLGELLNLWILKQQLEKLDEPPRKLLKWQQGKVENLLIALEHSKQMALSMNAYWN